MAEKTEFLQAIDDAILDTDSLERFINGSEDETVLTRLSAEYPTLQKALKELFENNGIAKRFKTLAELEISDLVAGDYALVADDTDDANGIYYKSGSTWVKSKYNITDIVDAHLVGTIDTQTGVNLFNKDDVIWGKQVVSTGVISNSEGRSISNYIPVEPNGVYRVSEDARLHGLVFTDASRTPIESSYNANKGAVIVTAPPNAAYLVINVDHPTIPSSNIMVSNGSGAKTYEPYSEHKMINESALPGSIITDSNLAEKVLQSPVVREYEVDYRSKNLFDESKIRDGYFLSTTTGGVNPAVGWGVSEYIPVEAGKKYTLSGNRGRQGVSFFATDGQIGPAINYINDETLPMTFTVPEGANYAVIAVYSASSGVSYDSLMLEEGDKPSEYSPFGSYTAVDYNYIVNTPKQGALPSKATLVLEIGGAQIKASDEHDIVTRLSTGREYTRDKSTVFNFLGTSIDGLTVKISSDDASPLRLDGATVGANHGYNRTDISGSHGKTHADVGSVWSDGSNQWVIVDVPSATRLSVSARYANIGLSSDTLTHVSGASNSSAIDASNRTGKQWYPSINNRSLSLYVDGAPVPIDAIGNYNYADSVDFHESYTIAAKNDILEWIIANGKKQLDYYDAAPSVLCSYTYSFDAYGGCIIYASLTCLKDIDFSDFMVTQSHRIEDANRLFYVPKTKQFSQDGVTYKFSLKQPMPEPIANSILFDASKNEDDASPVDRLVQLSSNFGYATGYLPMYDAEPSVRPANASNKYLEIRNNSLKTYPRLIDGLKSRLVAGDSFAAIAYRKYFKRDNNRTAKYVVRSNVADYLYLDWHTAKTDIIDMPDDLIGRSFTVHEKSSNVTVLSKFATNNIAVKIDSTKSYGYLVLRFEK